MKHKFIKYDPVTGRIKGEYSYSIGLKEEDIDCDPLTGNLTEKCLENQRKRNKDFFDLHYPNRLEVGRDITQEEFDEAERDKLDEIDLVKKKPKRR